MRKKYIQMSLSDIYNDVSLAIEEKKPKLIALLEEHIDFDKIVPVSFFNAFYSDYGRKNIYHLSNRHLWSLYFLYSFIHFPLSICCFLSRTQM